MPPHSVPSNYKWRPWPIKCKPKSNSTILLQKHLINGLRTYISCLLHCMCCALSATHTDTWNLFCACVEVLLYRSVYRKAIIKKIVICCLYQARLGHLNSSQVAIRLAIRIKTFHLKLIFSDDQIIVLLYSRCNNWRLYQPNIVYMNIAFICDMVKSK